MQNGCPECEKLGDDFILCDMCELGMLQCTAGAALADYVAKVNEILKKQESEVKNGLSGS